MWVYFNVPEANYLKYMAGSKQDKEDHKIELKLANGKMFSQTGKIGAIEAQFNNETGNIAFRADFPIRTVCCVTVRPDRPDQPNAQDAVVIPQRATFDVLDKRYVYVMGEDYAVHQREISKHEMETFSSSRADLT